MEEKILLTCIFCDEEKEDVGYRIDPHGYELNDDDSTYPICDDCAYDRAMDV